MPATLDTAIDQAILRLETSNGVGTAFSVGSGFLVTCSHVVDSQAPHAIVGMHLGRPVKVECVRSEARVSLFDILWPDLALLRIEDPRHTVPPVVFGADPRTGSHVLGRGFARGQDMICPFYAAVEGPVSFGSGSLSLTQLNHTGISRGMSGAPAVDVDSGRVCGMLTMTRGEDTNLGGFLVPISLLKANLPEVFGDALEEERGRGPWAQLLTGAYDGKVELLRLLYSEIPEGPPVPARSIPLLLIGGYAGAVAEPGDRLRAVVCADALYRRALLPAAAPAGIAPAEVTPPQNSSPLDSWTELMHVTGKRSRRLLAAVLHCVPDDRLPDDARRLRDDFIEGLKAKAP